MRSPISHRAAAITAVTATAAFTAASLAAAGPAAAAPSGTTLSISAPASDPGLQAISVSGTLTSGGSAVAGQPVLLEVARPGRPMAPLGRGRVTSSSGAVSFKVRAAGTWQWELVFPGAAGLAPARSQAVTITVP